MLIHPGGSSATGTISHVHLSSGEACYLRYRASKLLTHSSYSSG